MRAAITLLGRGAAAALIAAAFVWAPAVLAEGFSPVVDARGNISLPRGCRTNWAFLGTWSIMGDMEGGSAKEMHSVYTEAKTVAAYRKTGKWPDGAVLIKEVLKTKTNDMTTGCVSRAAAIHVIFVMVKNAKGRSKGNPLWGNGWGWGLFKAPNLAKQVATDYKSDCLGCHIPAKQDDWVYFRGYPVLR